MLALFKRTLLFRGPKGQKHLVTASSDVQAVPDWVANTNAFKSALVKDKGGLQAITITGPPGRSVIAAEREAHIREKQELTEKLTTANARIAELEAQIKAASEPHVETLGPELAKAARQGSKK